MNGETVAMKALNQRNAAQKTQFRRAARASKTG
jgi:hypothetical protein